jgi:hypothetical protein
MRELKIKYKKLVRQRNNRRKIQRKVIVHSRKENIYFNDNDFLETVDLVKRKIHLLKYKKEKRGI